MEEPVGIFDIKTEMNDQEIKITQIKIKLNNGNFEWIGFDQMEKYPQKLLISWMPTIFSMMEKKKSK
jgi:hypothetical protein